MSTLMFARLSFLFACGFQLQICKGVQRGVKGCLDVQCVAVGRVHTEHAYSDFSLKISEAASSPPHPFFSDINFS